MAFPRISVILFFQLKLCTWSVNERKTEERERMMKILKEIQAIVTAYLKFVCNEYLVNIDFSEKQTHFVISK